MRISVWQQFSSNHSASFTVIGVFEDPTIAQTAAETIRGAVQQITDWYAEHEVERDAVVRESVSPPTQAELQVCEQFDITCQWAVDWLADCGLDEGHINHFYQFVTVSNVAETGGCETWSGADLFESLMEKLASYVFIREATVGREIVVDISCSLPANFDGHMIVQLLEAEIPDWKSSNISYDEGSLTITDIYFLQYTFGLRSMLAWLFNHGCTNIECFFGQE